MDAAEAARTLARALEGQGADFTIADAATKSGLPLRDAERGLHALVSEYRGHLRVTDDGDLLFRFPHGFTKPWERRARLARVGRAVLGALEGAGRFVVRAWITIVLLGYVGIFLAILVGLTLARSSSSDSRDDRGFGLGMGYLVMRIVADALFWTFHPFSPFAFSYGSGRDEQAGDRSRAWGQGREERKKGPHFYEKVNRFFFGPDAPPPDPRAMERRILAEIRAQKGRIGLADVMRVTGLPRDAADPMMARLMLDYDGTVEVTDEGSLVYRFAEMRKSVVEERIPARPAPIWAEPERLAPLTGNSIASNLLIGGLNAFNLIMSLWALSASWTLAKIGLLLRGVPLAEIPAGGTAIALGVVPLVFSIALFALPAARALLRPLKARRVARENGRRALLRVVLERPDGVTEESLQNAWRSASGEEPDPKELTHQVVALGGDVDLEKSESGVRYRFPELQAEAEALQAEREAAAEEEARVGKVIFSSDR